MSLSVEQMHHEKSLLLFRVEPYKICVPSVDVEAIITVPTFRSIPHAPFAMRGVFSYRGQIASVISLRRKFGLQDYIDANTGQLIVARISCGLTGFWVDEVLDIVASTGEDVIALSVLSRLTVFDHFLILDDQIAQHTTFEQIYQAPDASPRKHSPQQSAPSQEVEDGHEEEADDRPSAGTAEVIQLDTADSAGEEADPAVGVAVDENALQPDANKKGLEAPPDRKSDSTADVVDLRSHLTNSQAASATFRLKSRSAPKVITNSKQRSHQSDRRQTAVAAVKPPNRFSRDRIAYNSAAASHIQPEVNDRSTRRRRYSIFTVGSLLLAGLILLTYWLWPQDKRFIPVARVLETEKIIVTTDPIPTASSKDASRELWQKIETQQDTARSMPTLDYSNDSEKVTGSITSTKDTLGDSAGEPRSEIEEEKNTVRSTPTWNDNAAPEKETGSVSSPVKLTEDSARELQSETEEEQNSALPTPTWNDNVVDEKVTDPVISSGEMRGDSARELRSETEEEQNSALPTPTWNDNVVGEKVTSPVISPGEIPGDSVREMRPKIDAEQNPAQPIPVRDHYAAAEKVTGSETSTEEISSDSNQEMRTEIGEEQNPARPIPVRDYNIVTGEVTGISAREIPSETEEEQKADPYTPAMDHSDAAEEAIYSKISTEELPGDYARELISETEKEKYADPSTPAMEPSAAAEEVTGSVATTGGIAGDSDGELPSEIKEEQNVAQLYPDRDNRTVAEKALDSATTTGGKVEEKLGNNNDKELMTYRVSASKDPQTTQEKAPLADESADQLLKIETDDFTLTVERGQSGKPYKPPQAGSAPVEKTLETVPSPTSFDPLVTAEYTHIVVKGDTLWDIAARYLGNPFRYPELAELSRIKNPHWIYPGDIIRIIKKKVPGKSHQ
jgi:chemotaxis signal transduction protein/LysM repeat protein